MFTRPCGRRNAVIPTERMGIADRDYHRNRPQGGGFMQHVTPVVKWLLFLNAGIYILDMILGETHGRIHGYPPLVNSGAFTVQTAIFEYRLWEFFTFQFLHGSLGHVLFNCIGLYFFGPWMERWWGSVRFLVFYLLCGAAGAAFFTILLFLHAVPGDMQSPLIGASAGIYGIFIGVAVIAPNLRVMLLFPPIELSIRQLAIGLMAISTGAIVFSLGGNEGGDAGHLGGAILGFIVMRMPWLLGGNGHIEIIRPGLHKPRPESKLRPRTRLGIHQDSAVDEILDKVSRDGFQSLTQDERDVLLKASQRQNQEP